MSEKISKTVQNIDEVEQIHLSINCTAKYRYFRVRQPSLAFHQSEFLKIPAPLIFHPLLLPLQKYVFDMGQCQFLNC